EYVNVELPFKVDRILVLDINGKQVKEISNPSVGVNLIQIEELSSGNYFVKLESGNKTRILRFVK
ncbi:T9SS type A sorting domain-containing protein, partial [Flavobacteriaceae bacterium]|nr:T9SS type A sorting domain-containing protein [Flavobacteriaceae bacterium]